ncbi:thiopurine S-Methyltransferase [Colletotrichum higginsianum]|nr:thiopurine S-Methyltransferase [Colletotrichum higginsianum]
MANESNKLSTTFADAPLSDHGPKWSAFWEEKYTPWDRGGPSLALLDILTTRPDLVPPTPSPAEQKQSSREKPTALVPGSKENEKAIAAKLEAETEAPDEDLEVYAIRHPSGAEPGCVTWLSGDFFSDSWLEEWNRGKAFDLIFDYTFLCALPPTARSSWATRMATLLSPRGRLVCLEFPSGKPLSQPGPPWGLTPEIYLALLSRPGEPLEFSSSTQAGDAADVVVVPPFREDGLRRLELVKPTRTHRAGMNEDGTVRDWIHVWSH